MSTGNFICEIAIGSKLFPILFTKLLYINSEHILMPNWIKKDWINIKKLYSKLFISLPTSMWLYKLLCYYIKFRENLKLKIDFIRVRQKVQFIISLLKKEVYAWWKWPSGKLKKFFSIFLILCLLYFPPNVVVYVNIDQAIHLLKINKIAQNEQWKKITYDFVFQIIEAFHWKISPSINLHISEEC